MNSRSLKDILADQLEVKGITLDDLSVKTGVPEQYIKAIFNDRPEGLPPLPYIRTHLLKLADFLQVDRNAVLDAYRAEFAAKLSGPADRLPPNRFAFERQSRRWLWVSIGAIVLILIIYALAGSGFFGTPSFKLINPPQSNEVYETSETSIVLSGITEPNGKLAINGQPVPVHSDGTFEYEYALSLEMNIIEFTVERFLGKTVTVTQRIYVQPPILELSATSTPATTSSVF